MLVVPDNQQQQQKEERRRKQQPLSCVELIDRRGWDVVPRVVTGHTFSVTAKKNKKKRKLFRREQNWNLIRSYRL